MRRRQRALVAGLAVLATAGSLGAGWAHASSAFTEYDTNVGAGATMLDTVDPYELSGINSCDCAILEPIVGRPGGATIVPLDARGLPGVGQGVGLGLAVDPSAVATLPVRGATPDLLIADRAGSRLLDVRHARDGWHTVDELPTGAAPSAMTPIDWESARPDVLAVANAGSNDISLFSGAHNALLSDGRRATGAGPAAIVATFDRLLVASAGSNSVTVLSGPHFDGRQDVVVGQAPVALAAFDAGFNVQHVAVADAGSADLAILEARGGNPGVSRVGSVELPGARPVAVAAGLLDRDVFADLAVADAAGNQLLVLRGTSNGSFRVADRLALPGVPVAVAVGNFGGDDQDDIAVAGQSGVLSIFITNGDELLASANGIDIAAGHGHVVWSQRVKGGYGLFAVDARTVARLKTGSSGNPIEARFGTGPSGDITVAYIRCRGRSCAAYRYDFTTAHEQRVPGVHVPRGCKLTGVSTWRSRIAYTIDRSYAPAPPCPRRARGAWGRLSAHAHPRRLTPASATLGSFTGTLVGWTEYGGSESDVYQSVNIANLSSGRTHQLEKLVGDAAINGEDSAPFIDRGAFYWANYTALNAGPISYLTRQRGFGRAACRRLVHYDVARQRGDVIDGLPGDNEEGSYDWAVDAGQLYYVTQDSLGDSAPFRVAPGRLTKRLSCGGHR